MPPTIRRGASRTSPTTSSAPACTASSWSSPRSRPSRCHEHHPTRAGREPIPSGTTTFRPRSEAHSVRRGTITPMTWRERLGNVIFETDAPAARAFDVALLVAILASVLAVMLESVPTIRASYGATLRVVEWTFTGLFTLEYLLRLVTARKRRRYVLSFFGIVDLAAILPAYL